MKRFFLMYLVASLSSCTTTPRSTARVFTDEEQEFAPLRDVLERNCVHCHGDNRLSTMPPINDTHALARLIGKHWIVPGKPETSRFYQVVTFPDTVPGAMPPSGHAISKTEAQTLRKWIKDGARLPAQNVKLTPHGPLPRSS